MKKIRYIGMAARMVPDKLHDLFIEMIFLNRLFFINNRIKVLFAGDGLLLKSLKQKVKYKKLQNIIIFNGRLKEDDLIKWFRKLDAYVHLSKDETTSTSILQAMSMSLPIIASNIGGNKNLIKSINSVSNIVLVNNNISKIYKKIKYLILNKKIIKKMSYVSRKVVVKYYSCETMFKNYQKLF
jgi:glycosyltransferase involved in cell wall biosynthesis